MSGYELSKFAVSENPPVPGSPDKPLNAAIIGDNLTSGWLLLHNFASRAEGDMERGNLLCRF
jgi:hypothetical protein